MYFNGLLLLSAQFVRIATNDMLVITNGTVFVSAHRVRIATFNPISITHCLNFASAHRVQIATLPVEHAGVHRILCLSAPRADRNTCRGPEQTPDGTLPQRTACRSQPVGGVTRYNEVPFASAHRVQIATDSGHASGYVEGFASAHRVQIATANVHKAPRADLWNAL